MIGTAPPGEPVRRFRLALLGLARQRQRTRCADPGDRDRWLSDDADERAYAAALCAGCPVLVECGEAAEAMGERFGVWGGWDYGHRPTVRHGDG